MRNSCHSQSKEDIMAWNQLEITNGDKYRVLVEFDRTSKTR